MSANATADDNSAELTEEDLIGKRIFNEEKYMGQDVIVDVKTVRNGYGDEKRVFVCDKGASHDGRRFINRDVDSIMSDVTGDSAWDAYEIGELFNDVDESDYDL